MQGKFAQPDSSREATESLKINGAETGCLFPPLLKLIWLPALFLLLPFLYAYFFCAPFGDDFDEATKALFIPDLPGALYNMARAWLTWSGRYAYHFCTVLFAATIRQPALFSIACFLPVSVFLIAFSKFSPLFTRFPAALFACLCLLVFYSNFHTLWYFYTFMDAFSSILQVGAFFLFAFFCLRLYLGNAKSHAGCVISGLFAIGIYETAALAVFWTSLGFLLADAFREINDGSIRQSLRSLWPNIKKSAFWPVQLWICGGLLLSFLAPGNFARASIRHTSLEQTCLQLQRILPTLLQIIKKFFLGSWLIEVFALTMLGAIFSAVKPAVKLSAKIPLAILPLALWLLFALSSSIVIALSDASLSTVSKFQDIFSCYLALALGFCLFPPFAALAARQCLSPGPRAILAILLAAILLASVFMSRNFKQTSINAANGEIARYSQFYREREAELERRAAAYAGNSSWPEFGFLGELKNPAARATRIIADKPHVILDEWQGGAFPIWFSRVFKRKANTWPNERASWLYNVGSLKAAFPQSAKALAAAGHAPASASMPRQLADAGIMSVKLVMAPGFGGKPYLWIFLKCEKQLPSGLKLFVPAQISAQRLLPIPCQEFLYQTLKAGQRTEPGIKLELAGAILNARMAAKVADWRVFPVLGYFSTPDFIYLSIDAKIFDKILFTP